MTSEAAITAKIKSYLKANGFMVRKQHGGPYSSGWPDLDAVKDGQYYAFEVKNEKGVASKLQLVKIRDLKKHGAVAGVVRSVEETERLIEENQK